MPGVILMRHGLCLQNSWWRGRLFFIMRTVNKWIDIFTRKIYAEIIVDSRNYCVDRKGLIIYEYVIMSNPRLRTHSRQLKRFLCGTNSRNSMKLRLYPATIIIEVTPLYCIVSCVSPGLCGGSFFRRI